MIRTDYNQRMSDIMDLSWTIFKSQFVNGKLNIDKEAPFQLHFANIIKSVGELFCLQKTEIFQINLETKVDNVRGKSKYVDITCGFLSGSSEYNVAIELKFKTKRQSAQDLGRMDSYADLEALELVEKNGYSQSRFFIITNSSAYIKPSTRGTGTIFSLHDGHNIEPGTFEFAGNNSQDPRTVKLEKHYSINWETHRHKDGEDYYFMQC